jgi:hypothetical protein
MENKKKITMTGQNNRYQIKKLIIDSSILQQPKIYKKSEQWNLQEIDYSFENQQYILNQIYEKWISNEKCEYSEQETIMIQQINQKINGYKNQDKKKNRIQNENDFIDFFYIVNKLKECQMLCYYCHCSMYILYSTARNKSQWTVDRINNDIGHEKTNINLVCLECNLKRKRTNDTKFMFTSQFLLKKMDCLEEFFEEEKSEKEKEEFSEKIECLKL